MGKSLVFVGIDPSISNTGVVAVNNNGNVCLHLNGGHSKLPYAYDIECYDVQVQYIIDSLLEFNIVALAYEDYSYHSVHRGYSLAEFGGILKNQLRRIAPQPLLISPCRLKKFATGKGSSTKAGIIKQACQESLTLAELDKAELTSDVCDAYFLAKLAWYVHSPEKAVAKEQNVKFLRERLEVAKETQLSKLNQWQRSSYV